MNALNFSTKETYIAWRTEWRNEYKELSSQIRTAKLEFKNQQRNNSISYVSYSNLRMMQKKANEMLELRAQSKIEAQEQYLRQKEECHV